MYIEKNSRQLLLLVSNCWKYLLSINFKKFEFELSKLVYKFFRLPIILYGMNELYKQRCYLY